MSYFGTTEWYHRVAAGQVPGYKVVDKWGRNESVATTFEPIISDAVGALWQPTAASTVRIAAGGNANDTAAGTGCREVTIEGLDDTYALASETIATAGASASTATTTSFTRVFRAYGSAMGTYLGVNADEIMIETSDGVTNIITVDAHDGGQGQSLHCAYSVPDNTRAYLVHLYYNADTTKANDVHLRVADEIDVVAAPFGATRTLVEFEGVVEAVQFVPVSPILLNKPGIDNPFDVWVAGHVSAGTSVISARMQLLLESTDGAF